MSELLINVALSDALVDSLMTQLADVAILANPPNTTSSTKNSR